MRIVAGNKKIKIIKSTVDVRFAIAGKPQFTSFCSFRSRRAVLYIEYKSSITPAVAKRPASVIKVNRKFLAVANLTAHKSVAL